MALNAAITEIADLMARDLRTGTGTRETVGAKGEAWSWVGGLPVTLASFVGTTKSEGLSFPVTTVSPHATTPAKVVAEGALKPTATQLATQTISLKKFAGLSEVTLEQTLSTNGLLPAVAQTLGAGCLLAYEADAMATLDAQSGGTATGATWLAGILSAQAQIIGAGGSPGVVVVSHQDYAALIGELGGSAGFVTDPRSAVGQAFGSLIHVSPKLATGKAFVLDGGAVLAVQHEQSPLGTTDPYSKSDVNVVRLVFDLVAATVVASPALVIEVSKSATQAASTSSKSK